MSQDERYEVVTYVVRDRDGNIITRGLKTEDEALARVDKWFADYLKGPLSIERVTFTGHRHTETFGSYRTAPSEAGREFRASLVSTDLRLFPPERKRT